MSHVALPRSSGSARASVAAAASAVTATWRRRSAVRSECRAMITMEAGFGETEEEPQQAVQVVDDVAAE